MKHFKELRIYIIVALIATIVVVLGYYNYLGEYNNIIKKSSAVIAIFCIANIMCYFNCKSGLIKDDW